MIEKIVTHINCFGPVVLQADRVTTEYKFRLLIWKWMESYLYLYQILLNSCNRPKSNHKNISYAFICTRKYNSESKRGGKKSTKECFPYIKYQYFAGFVVGPIYISSNLIFYDHFSYKGLCGYSR